MLDWVRLWLTAWRLNRRKALHQRKRAARGPFAPRLPAPCQSGSDSGRAWVTRCEACLALDRPERLRWLCPDLRPRPEGVFCGRDSAEIRPRWGRAALALAGPLVLGALLGVITTWVALNRTLPGHPVSFAEVAWPPAWSRIQEKRRLHFRDLALVALARGDLPAASVALFTAAQSGRGSVEDNHALARIATLGGFHGLADQLHEEALAAHPALRPALSVAWLDDLLIAHRGESAARLALSELAAPDAPRELWLRAYFETVTWPGVASALEASPPAAWPHPGLARAAQARSALARHDALAASDALIALENLPPGAAARRFLVLAWQAAGRPAHALRLARSAGADAAPGEADALTCELALREGDPEAARLAALAACESGGLRAVLATLVSRPDPALVRTLAPRLAASASPADVAALWLAARRAGAEEIAADCEPRLAAAGHQPPDKLRTLDLHTPAHGALDLAASLLPVDREIHYALRQP